MTINIRIIIIFLSFSINIYNKIHTYIAFQTSVDVMKSSLVNVVSRATGATNSAINEEIKAIKELQMKLKKVYIMFFNSITIIIIIKDYFVL
jgi:hypothetical protein